ncbi:MAG: flagellar motor switch protein FliM [Lachnospiraceae bacterium]|nr:flagellar motor switch protein FliM [Lachnospiraceae bacterium]
MADVLSQSQIDELLRSMQSSEPEPDIKPVEQVVDLESVKYIKYDFYSPRKFTKDKMKILQSAFENYARILTSQVNGIFRVMTDITVLEVQERRYYEFVNSFHENDCMALIDTHIAGKGVNNIPSMMFVTPGLILTLINHMLGGGDEVVKTDTDYRYSDVELALYKRVVEYFTLAIKDGFSNYINVDFDIRRIEENPGMVQEVGLDETVVIILLNVDIAGLAIEKIKICMPGTVLESMFQIIDRRKHLARGFSYEDNKETILDNIRYTQLPVTGQLGTVMLDLSDLYRLQKGDVIDMSRPVGSNVTLFVGRQPWFTGEMGVYKKNMAVRIKNRIYKETDNLEELTEK